MTSFKRGAAVLDAAVLAEDGVAGAGTDGTVILSELNGIYYERQD